MKVEFDDSLNELSWDLWEWVKQQEETPHGVFNNIKPKLQEIIQRWIDEHAAQFKDEQAAFRAWVEGRGFGSFTTRELLLPCWMERARIASLFGAPAEPHVKSTPGEAAVDQGSFFLAMTGEHPCPVNVKVQLLNPDNVAVYGVWNGKDSWPKGWAPLPKIPPGMR